MAACPWSVRELLTHSGDKVLLDTILDYDDDGLVAQARIKPDSVYLKNGAEPGWMGLEYMAQAVAAYAGIRARNANGEPKVGMLIGTRRYSISRAAFPPGMELVIETRVLLEDENGLSVFQCSIQHGDEQVASANLNVYQPHNIQHYLESAKST